MTSIARESFWKFNADKIRRENGGVEVAETVLFAQTLTVVICRKTYNLFNLLRC